MAHMEAEAAANFPAPPAQGNDDTVAVIGVILGLHRGYIGVI